MSKNIKEFVVENVIKYMKYQDLEIEQLQSRLDEMYKKMGELGFGFCDICHKFEKCGATCDFCEIVSCTRCCNVFQYQSWNLSGTLACRACVELYCTRCKILKGKCEHFPVC